MGRKFSLPNSRQNVYANLLVGFSFLIFSFLTFTMLSPIVSSNAEKVTAEDGAVYVASLSTDNLTQIAVIPTNEQTVFSGNNSIKYANSCPYGFNVSMSSSTSNTGLTRAGDDSGSKAIKSVSTSGPLEDNSWGYSLDDGETYNPIPSLTSPVTLVNTVDEITTETTKNVKYGIKLNSDIPSGSYSSDIVYTVAVKPRCITYDLKWNLNGGTGASGVSYADKTINYGNTINLQTYKPTREGYTFEGWTTSAGYTFGPTIGEIDVNPSNTNGVTLTAKWKLIDYNIEYTLNGGSATNPASYNIETNTITLNNPTRTGYTFSGWSGTGLSGSANKSVTIPKGSTGAKLFVANWSVNKYTVTYEDWFVDASNNRKVKLGSATKSVNYGTSVSGTELGTDTSSGKYYSSYSYRSATSGTVPANNNLVVYRYFYAWTDLNIYYAGGSTQGGATVSLSTNGSNWTDVTNESNTIQPYGTTYYIKNIRPVHSYEEFDRVENLSYNSSAGYYTYTPTTAGTSMSIWMKYKTYSISYNLNGGSASNPTSYNYTSSFTLNNPTRGGYNFTGWSGTGLSGSANRSVTIPSGSTGNRSYTANWSAACASGTTSSTLNLAVNGSKDYGYTGTPVCDVIAKAGRYRLEVWGAQGGSTYGTGGYGGYSVGTISVAAQEAFYIYVGNQPTGINGGWNGGGAGDSSDRISLWIAGGGGASDIRYRGTDLGNRVIVAGGGGGGMRYVNADATGSAGGGLTGGNPQFIRLYKSATWSSNVPSKQDGTVDNNDALNYECGGNWYAKAEVDVGTRGYGQQGGGGGYYGGSYFRGCDIAYSGGGGSGYVGGVSGGSTTAGQRAGNGYARITYLGN